MIFFNKQSIIYCSTYYNSCGIYDDDVLIILGIQIIKRNNMDSDNWCLLDMLIDRRLLFFARLFYTVIQNNIIINVLYNNIMNTIKKILYKRINRLINDLCHK